MSRLSIPWFGLIGMFAVALGILLPSIGSRIRHGPIPPPEPYRYRPLEPLADYAQRSYDHTLRLWSAPMSYSLPTVTADRDRLDEALTHAIRDQVESGGDHECHNEIADHLRGVVGAVSQLAANVGRSEDTISVQISGHANPGHGPRPGYSPEFLTVNLYVKEPTGSSADDETHADSEPSPETFEVDSYDDPEVPPAVPGTA